MLVARPRICNVEPPEGPHNVNNNNNNDNNNNFLTENSMRYTLHQIVAATCDIKHKPPHYTTPENRLTD